MVPTPEITIISVRRAIEIARWYVFKGTLKIHLFNLEEQKPLHPTKKAVVMVQLKRFSRSYQVTEPDMNG